MPHVDEVKAIDDVMRSVKVLGLARTLDIIIAFIDPGDDEHEMKKYGPVHEKLKEALGVYLRPFDPDALEATLHVKAKAQPCSGAHS